MAKKNKSVLWELTHPDTHFTSYVLGTMHVRDQKAFGLFDHAKSLIDRARLVACEYDLSQVEGSAHSQAMLLPKGQRISDLISVKKYKKIKSILDKSFGMSLDNYDRMLPMVLMGVISSMILNKDNQHSLDQSIWDYGMIKGKEMTGVEPYESQLHILKNIDLSYQTKALIDACKNISKYRSQIISLTKQYQDQEIHLLYKNTKKSLGKYRAILLFDRNITMTDRIDKLSKQNHCFFAIGAAHLSGKRGVLRLLKKESWRLKPI